MSVTRAEIHELAREHRRLRLTRGARTDEDLVPRQRVPDYRTRLDSRIGRCPGCDGWCWDGACTCGPPGASSQVSGKIGPTTEAGPGALATHPEPSPQGSGRSLMTCPPSYPPGGCPG